MIIQVKYLMQCMAQGKCSVTAITYLLTNITIKLNADLGNSRGKGDQICFEEIKEPLV